jgi:hypothetical protein
MLQNYLRPVPDSLAEGLATTAGGSAYRFTMTFMNGYYCYTAGAGRTSEVPRWPDDDFPTGLRNTLAPPQVAGGNIQI